jgi:hypothetical protein
MRTKRWNEKHLIAVRTDGNRCTLGFADPKEARKRIYRLVFVLARDVPIARLNGRIRII